MNYVHKDNLDLETFKIDDDNKLIAKVGLKMKGRINIDVDKETTLPEVDDGVYTDDTDTKYLVVKNQWEKMTSVSRRGMPLTSIADLRALKPLNDEFRAVNTSDYRFKNTDRLTQEEKDDILNLSPDAPNDTLGKWILQPTGKFVNFDYQLGNIVHAIPDTSKAVYEINGQTITDAKLARFIEARPIAGFHVTGDDIKFPDWRGHYLGASGGKGIASGAGATYRSANKRHRHSVNTGDNANGTRRYQIHWADHDNGNKHRQTDYEGETYARPETSGMPMCIIGGRKMDFKIDPELVPIVEVPVDDVHTISAKKDGNAITVTFAKADPAEIKIGARVWDGHHVYQSVSFSQLRAEGTMKLTVRGMNDANNRDEDFGIQYDVTYVSDTQITVNVTASGYTGGSGGSSNWIDRTNDTYSVERVVAVYKTKKSIVQIKPTDMIVDKTALDEGDFLRYDKANDKLVRVDNPLLKTKTENTSIAIGEKKTVTTTINNWTVLSFTISGQAGVTTTVTITRTELESGIDGTRSEAIRDVAVGTLTIAEFKVNNPTSSSIDIEVFSGVTDWTEVRRVTFIK